MSDLLIAVVVTVGSVLGTLITVGLPLLLAKTKAIKDARIREMVEGLATAFANAASKAVPYVQQTYVDALKTAGKFGEAEKQKALQMATDSIIANLSCSFKEFAVQQGISILDQAKVYAEAKIKELATK